MPGNVAKSGCCGALTFVNDRPPIPEQVEMIVGHPLTWESSEESGPLTRKGVIGAGRRPNTATAIFQLRSLVLHTIKRGRITYHDRRQRLNHTGGVRTLAGVAASLGNLARGRLHPNGG